MKKSMITLGLTAVLSLGSAVQAATLWDNGGVAAVSPGASNMSGFHQAANFSTSFATNLTGLTFWTLEGARTYAGNIHYSIFGDSGGALDAGNLLGSGLVSATRTGEGTALGLNVFRNELSFSLNALAAGNYWIALHNGDLSSGSDAVDFYWAWADANATNGGAFDDMERSLFPSDPTWGTNQAEHAFVLLGDRVINQVSEPGALLLALLASALAVAPVRRRRA